MKKIDWLKKHLTNSKGEALESPLILDFVTRVEAAGEALTRAEFCAMLERSIPEDNSADFFEFMVLESMLGTADMSEAWEVSSSPEFPKIKVVAKFEGERLPSNFVKIGGKPKWIHGDATPICGSCDKDMSLLIQMTSPDGTDECLEEFCFGDAGRLYVFACSDCNEYKTYMQCG